MKSEFVAWVLVVVFGLLAVGGVVTGVTANARTEVFADRCEDLIKENADLRARLVEASMLTEPVPELAVSAVGKDSRDRWR